MDGRIYNVLFLCTGNSARSILAEALLNHDGAGRFRAYSAGSFPKGEVHPMALDVLQSLGFPHQGFRSKSWDEFAGDGAPRFDFIFTVCDNAAGETCPIWPGHPMTAHWGIEDPAAVDGEGQRDAFIQALRYLRRLAAEALGSFFLFATVVGSGIMAERLAGGNVAIALLGNTLATGAILFVLITMFGPVSGAHFNPAVSLVAWLRKDLTAKLLAAYVAAQLIGGLLGVWTAHLMFEETVLQISAKARTGTGQWAGEFVATFGLVLAILGTFRWRPKAVPASVALYITAAYWFTSSTSFANPAITIARSLTDSFAGIAPADTPAFIAAQLAGALAAHAVARLLFDEAA